MKSYALPIMTVVATVTAATVVFSQTSKPSLAEPANPVSVSAQNATAPSPPSREPAGDHAASIRANLFAPPAPPPSRTVSPASPAPGPRAPSKPVATPVVPASPLADYSYTGTILLGEKRWALVENRKTKAGEYLKVGDRFVNGTVLKISDESVTLRIGRKKHLLAKNENYTFTPLSRTATFLAGGPSGTQTTSSGNPTGGANPAASAPTGDAQAAAAMNAAAQAAQLEALRAQTELLRADEQRAAEQQAERLQKTQQDDRQTGPRADDKGKADDKRTNL